MILLVVLPGGHSKSADRLLEKLGYQQSTVCFVPPPHSTAVVCVGGPKHTAGSDLTMDTTARLPSKIDIVLMYHVQPALLQE